MAAAFCVVTAPAGAETAPKWGAHVDVEGKAGSKRHLGEVDLFLPLAQDERTLLFADLRTRMDDNESREGNFGVGLRHMLEGDWNLGAYGYFDRRRSEFQNYFNQVTLGAEALSLDWDLRANAYIGIGDRRRVLDDRTTGGGTTASLVGSTVMVSVADTTRSVIEERSLSGFDAEIGWRVPVFDPEQGVNLRIYGGGYSFSADQAPDVAGPRGRLELTLDQVPGLWAGARLTLGGEVQHDDPRGTQGFLSARLRIPLGGGTEASRLTAQERRMTDPVVRDIDVVTSGAVARSTVTAPGFVEVATETASGQKLAVVNSATTAGADLDEAVAAAGANSTVLLSGSFTTTATIRMQPGQTLMGAGTLTIRSPSGRTATLTNPAATVQTSAVITAIEMAANSTLMGMTVSNSWSGGFSNTAIEAYQPGAVIRGNVITATNSDLSGRAVGIGGGVDGIIDGNTIVVRSNGPLIYAIFASNNANVTVSGNTIDSNLYSIDGNNHTSFTAASTGNVLIGGGCNAHAAAGKVYFTDGSSCPN